ncbi:hypothetical protein N7467_010708 [Penicillium canescens]|nr:hypothetical protein N7467_010708 [Penicillium canescens]
MMDEIHGSPQTAPADADNNSYVLGTVGKFKVVVACLPLHQLGASSATASAKEMLFTFPKIRIGLLVGIGAGIPDSENERDIRLGDIVVGSDSSNGGVVVYDFGKKLADGSFQSISILNRPPRSLSSALANIKAEHDMQESKIMSYVEAMLARYPRMRKTGYCSPGKSYDRLFQPSYTHAKEAMPCSECDASQEIYRFERLDDEPLIHYGTIASGNIVVKDAAMRLQIQEKHSAICLEMEAAGLMNNFPCVVIRGISDYADSHKNDRWQPFAAAVAAAYAKELLEHVQPKIVDGEPALRDVLYQVYDEVKSITRFNSAQQNQHVLDWITPIDFSKKQNDLLSQTQEGTGAWFLQSDEFRSWLNSPNCTLLCPGIPGAGKSLMSSIVVDSLKREMQDPDVQVGCIFCDYQPAHRQTNIDLQLSLLKQLAVKDSQVLSNIEQLYSTHVEKKTLPTLQEVQTQLAKTARSYRMVYVVVDALDEFLAKTPEELQDFLTGILSLQMVAPVNILVTSRFNSAIMARFKGCQRKEIRAHEDDVLRYVNRRLPHLLFGQISNYPAIEDAVRREVVKSADGMFLLPMLNLTYLGGYTSPGELEDAVSTLPNGESRLETAYQKGIEIIRAQQLPSYKLAVKTLSWLAYAKRALFATELRHALGTHVGMKDFDPRYLTPIDIIDSVCAGLVVFDRKSGIIRLVHYTTKEFLVRDSTCENAETEITRISITYLSFGAFSEGRSTNQFDYRRRQELYPFFHYCAKYWAAHANAALKSSEDLLALILQFLDKELHVNAAAQATVAHSILADTTPSSNWMSFTSHQLSKVHLAAQGGLTRVIGEYIRQNLEIDAPDSRGKTPLAYAATGGHLETCRILLQSNRTNPNRESLDGETPVLLAAYSRNTEVLKVLIDHGANPDSGDDCSENALSVAAWNGDIEMMRVLLDNGADINHQSEPSESEDGTPLLNACCSGNLNAVLFLLERGGDPNLQNQFGSTILSAASENGNEELVKVLLERGVDVHPNTNSGDIPLAKAAGRGFSSITKRLLQAGADPNLKNDGNESSLISACGNHSEEGRCEEVVRHLLDHGADPNIQDGNLSTALSIAACNGSAGVVKLLLENGADPGIANKTGETALSEASRHGHEDSVKALLRGRADPDTRNKAFENSLFSAAKGGHASICKLLLDLGLSVNCQDIVGNSPLFLAACSGSESTVRLLIEKGADIQHRNQMRETVLFFAARSAVAKLLIEAGATPDPRNLISETPLIRAVGRLCETRRDSCKQDGISLIILFLENGADPNPIYHQENFSDTHRKAWDVLFSLTTVSTCIRWKEIEEQIRCCEASRQIWGSFVESYNHEQILAFLCKTICHTGKRFRSSWREGKATLLLWAVREAHVDLVAKVLRSRMSIDTQYPGENALLEEAVTSRSPQIMNLLLNRVVDPSMKSSYLPIMLQRAAENGDISMMELLFSKQSFDSSCASLALGKALQRGHVKVVEFLLERGAELHTAEESCSSHSLLHIAISKGGKAMVKLFLKHQIEIEIKDGRGQTPLFYAISRRDQAMAKLLLEQEIEVEVRDKFGRTPLFYAVQCRQSSIAQILLQRDVDPNITAFDCQEDNLDIEKELGLNVFSRFGPQSNKNEIGGLTPLFVAAGTGQRDLLKALLDKGADPNHRDNYGKTAICWAAGEGFEAIVKMLLDAGSSVNHPEDSSKSPLIWAVQKQRSGLLSNMIDTRDWTNGSYFPAKGDMEAVVRLLLQYGADPNPTDQNGQTPLHILSQNHNNSGSLVSSLLLAGSDPNKRNEFGRTPLMNAIVCGLNEMAAALLLSPNVDRDVKDIFGRTALIEATRRQNNKILKLLLPDCEANQPLAVISEPPEEDGDRSCDICRIWMRGEDAYSCLICNGGDFDICEECMEWGATCLNDTHQVERRSKSVANSTCLGVPASSPAR